MLAGPPTSLVTGASRGIGRGIAVELARLGYGVAINYATHREAAEESRNLCRGTAPPGSQAFFEIFQADISRAEDRARLLDEVRARFGWLDLLVNNAGVAPTVRVDILEASEESYDQVMGRNLKGPYFLTQAVAQFWVANLDKLPAGRHKPKIVNISSVSGYAVSVNRGEYCLSKAALSMMTRLFAVRLAECGINVYEIRPGIVATDMTAPVKEYYERRLADGLMPIRRWGTPEDVGRAVAAIAEDRFPFSTGMVIDVDGGYHLHRL
jgi:NAD(P)-dependent dehydrogenase (short-subunit alcohol dehydrogenase family)